MLNARRPAALVVPVLIAVAAAACSSDDASSPATTTARATTTAAIVDLAPEGPTASVTFVNVWSRGGDGASFDVYETTPDGAFHRVAAGVEYGSASEPVDVVIKDGVALLQVTKARQRPETGRFADNVQVNSVSSGEHSLVVVGWSRSGGTGGRGATQFQTMNLDGDPSISPQEGSVKVRVSRAGAPDRDLLLAVVGEGCLGDDGRDEPTVTLEPGEAQVQGVALGASTGDCGGKVVAKPVTIDGSPGSSWLIAPFGTAEAPEIGAFEVTPR